MKTPLEMAHSFLAEGFLAHHIAVDATMGKGYDTLFLAQYARQVYAFDIQEEALEQTALRLTDAGFSHPQLIKDSHAQVANYVNQVDRAIFNLGYLPGFDKSIVTKPNSTIVALQAMLTLLTKGGRIAVMVYWGHEGGMEEKEAVLSYVEKLSQKEFTVMSYQAVNQVNCPPFLIMIEKRI